MGVIWNCSYDDPHLRCVFPAQSYANHSTNAHIPNSVLTEAYSSRYKTAIHSGILDRALKSIHSQRRRPHSHSHHHHASSAPDPNALAIEIINNARAIREHMTWFINSSGTKGAPESVMKVLDDIAEGENMNKGVKKDFMSNDEARKVCRYSVSFVEVAR